MGSLQTRGSLKTIVERFSNLKKECFEHFYSLTVEILLPLCRHKTCGLDESWCVVPFLGPSWGSAQTGGVQTSACPAGESSVSFSGHTLWPGWKPRCCDGNGRKDAPAKKARKYVRNRSEHYITYAPHTGFDFLNAWFFHLKKQQ